MSWEQPTFRYDARNISPLFPRLGAHLKWGQFAEICCCIALSRGSLLHLQELHPLLLLGTCSKPRRSSPVSMTLESIGTLRIRMLPAQMGRKHHKLSPSGRQPREEHQPRVRSYKMVGAWGQSSPPMHSKSCPRRIFLPFKSIIQNTSHLLINQGLHRSRQHQPSLR